MKKKAIRKNAQKRRQPSRHQILLAQLGQAELVARRGDDGEALCLINNFSEYLEDAAEDRCLESQGIKPGRYIVVRGFNRAQ